MRNYPLLDALSTGFIGMVVAQSVTIYMPNGYKVVMISDSVNAPQAVSVATIPQTVYAVPTPAPVYYPYPYVRHLASVGEGMVIEYQIDDYHHQFENV